MSNIGQKLQQERQKRQLSLEEVNTKIGVSVRMLQAIEANNFSEVPAPYVRSFIRQFAELVDLNADELLQELGGEQTYKPKYNPKNYASDDSFNLEPNQLWIILLSVIGLVVLVFLLKSILDSPKEMIEKTQEVIEEPKTESLQEIQKVEEKITEAKVTESNKEKTTVESLENLLSENVAAQKEEKRKVFIGDSLSLEIIATDTVYTWVQVFPDDDSTKILNINIRNGAKIQRKAAEKFQVRTGNSGGIFVIFEGDSIGTPGVHGQILRKMILDRNGVSETELSPIPKPKPVE
ncbi:MAG: hypothetical protein DWQ06_06860 [Calditrichaeota bacterium]|nr:MAG: hypothetical protein DWQ06_06860 [Calditrichota bacterium]